jgi:hypothetical protein
MQTSQEHQNLVSSVHYMNMYSEISFTHDHHPFLSISNRANNGNNSETRYCHIVNHNYHDYSAVIDEGNDKPLTRGGILSPFPLKLHTILDSIENDGYAEVISWQPHGRCFVIHKPKDFMEYVMPKYFNHTKISSFQRQLNLYGFQRLTKGPDKGGYYNELFLRGKPFLACRIKRMRIKGTGVRARSNPNAEPDFLNMPPVIAPSYLQPSVTTSQSKYMEDMENVSKCVQVDALTRLITQEMSNDCAEFGGKQFYPLQDEDAVNVLHYDQMTSSCSTPISGNNFESQMFHDISSDEDLAQLMVYLIQ